MRVLTWICGSVIRAMASVAVAEVSIQDAGKTGAAAILAGLVS